MERKQWIDTLRGLCMIAILLYHTEIYYSGNYIIPYQCYVHNALTVFFFVSGYLFCGDISGGLKFSFTNKIRSIFKTLIVPYFIFTTLIGIMKIAVGNEEPLEVFLKIILGKASWFVAALIVAELLLSVTMLITRGKIILLSIVAALSFTMAFILGNKHMPSPLFYEQNLWYINDAFLALGIMICGIFYRRYEALFNRFNNILYTSLLFIISLISKIIIMYYDLNTVIGSIEISNIPLFIADIGIVTLFLVSISKLLGKLNIISWTGAHSLVYYFFCGAIPFAVTMVFNKIGFEYHNYWQIPIAFFTIYSLCTIVAFIIYRYFPVLVGKNKKGILAIIVLMFTFSTEISAQTFDEMKANINENSLPLINIKVDVNNIKKETYTDGEIEIFDPKGNFSQSHKCKLRYRGSSSLKYEKKSFAVKMIDEKGEDLDCNLFDIREKGNSWILDAMAIDKLRMRNILCFTIWNEFGKTPYETKFYNRNGIKGRYVEVCLNGNYHGLYCLSDKIDRKLLGLKKYKKKDNKIHGLLYKCISWGSSSNLESYDEAPTDQVKWNTWELKYPEDIPSELTWQPLIDFINFNSKSTSDEDFLSNYNDYFYVDNFLDYLIFINTLGITDNLYKNSYLSLKDIDEDHKIMITPWDMDSSLRRLYNSEENNNVFDVVSCIKNVSPTKRLYKYNKDNFLNKMTNRWNELSETSLKPEHLKSLMESNAEILNKSMALQRERTKWDNNPVELSTTIQDEINFIMEWYTMNYHIINSTMKNIITGIEEKITEQEQKNNAIFDMQGRKVTNPKHGIYIKDNSKFVVK